MIDMNRAKVLILGGTGTLGQAITKQLLESFPKIQIKILSRGEHKQAEMKRLYPKCTYVIGDIRNYDRIAPHFSAVNIVFHVAALKHVDTCEENVDECFETNYLGTSNAVRAAEMNSVSHFIFSSTDKAVNPINAYGFSKGAAEKLLFSRNKLGSNTKFAVYRWGNVLGSQGSVLPIFADTLKKHGVAKITDLSMTRFWLPIEWAVTYMMRSFADASKTKAMICPNMKTASVVAVVKATAKILGVNTYAFEVTGKRPGEKVHEVMVAEDNDYMASNTFEEYSEDKLIELIRPTVEACA